MAETLFFTGNGRTFLQRRGANPQNPTLYLGCHKVGGLDHSLGDITPVYCPDPTAYQKYVVADTIQGEAGLPSSSLAGKMGMDNPLMSLDCPFALHVHFGKCANPNDFNAGWDYGFVFADGRLTNRSTDDLVALAPGDEAEIMLSGDFTAREMLEKKRLAISEKATQQVYTEVVDVAICDTPSCGACGDESDGCQRIYAVLVGSGVGSPGLPAELVYSEDGGVTWADEDIDTLASTEDPSALACVGGYIVVVSHDSDSYHYADTDDVGTWAEVADGILAAGSPRDIFAYDAQNWWIVGDGGYIYFGSVVGDAVTVQSAGDVTAQNLMAVHGLSADFVVAVGENAAVVYTENGEDWVAATGTGLPPAVTLNCVWVRSTYVWMVGGSNGRLYYTANKGATFTEVAFPGSGAGEVSAIVFAGGNDSPIGYMAHKTAAPKGYLLESTDGGNSWFRIPRAPLTLVDNDGINAIATCDDPNFFAAGGLGADASDGIVLIGAA